MNKTFDKLKEVLEARRASLIAELHHMHGQEEKKLDAEASSLELTLGKITSKIGFVQQLLKNGSDVEIVSVSTEAKENMEKLKGSIWNKDTIKGSLMRVTLDSQMEDHLNEHGIITNKLRPEDIVISNIPDRINSGEEVRFTVEPSTEMRRRHYPLPKPDIKVTQDQQSRDEPCKLEYADSAWTASCLLPNPGGYTVSVNVDSIEAQMSPLTLVAEAIQFPCHEPKPTFFSVPLPEPPEVPWSLRAPVVGANSFDYGLLPHYSYTSRQKPGKKKP